VNFRVKAGEDVAVVGSVGSRKTACIKTLLGKLNTVPGIMIHDWTSGCVGKNMNAEMGTSALEHGVAAITSFTFTTMAALTKSHVGVNVRCRR
jgi:ABC-type branched-subunit amino acid transport system ATPase component